MNKIKLYVIGLALLIIGIVACEKGQLPNSENSGEFQYDVISKIDYSVIETKPKGFKSTNGSDQILTFKNMDAFKATLEELERQTEELDNAFVQFYSDLDEEALNAKEEEIYFSEQQPLLVFENTTSFNSLRQQIDLAEEQWLENEELDFDNDPDNHFVIEEEVRTLLNTDGEIQIGNSIYKLTKNGYFEIIDGDLKTLLSLDSKNVKTLTLPKNVIFVGDETPYIKSSDCKSMKSNWDFKASDKKRIKWRVSHRTWPWGRYASAKTKNYKKKGRRWKKYRTDTKTMVYGYISDVNEDGDADCSKQLNFNPNGINASGKKKSLKQKVSVATKTKSGWVKGYHSGAGGIEHRSTLTW